MAYVNTSLIHEMSQGFYNVTPSIINASEEEISRVIPSLFFMMKKPINQITLRIIKRYIKDYLGRGGVALDAGVGFGLVSGELAKAGFTVHGVDIDPYAIVASSKYISYFLQKPYLFFIADLNTASLPTGMYDVISCTETLEHLIEDRKVIKKLYDALILGGHGIFMVPIGTKNQTPNETDSREVDCLTGGKLKLYGHIREYDEKEFLKLLEETAFTILKSELFSGNGGESDPVDYTCIAVCVIKEDAKNGTYKTV